jgi:hypothetical protein
MTSTRKWRSVWWWTWRCAAGLIGVAVLAHAVATIVTGQRLAHELARLKASGAPVTMAQAAPPPVPDDKNAAVLYQQAFKWLPITGRAAGPEPGGEMDQITSFLALKDSGAKSFTYRKMRGTGEGSVQTIEQILSRHAPIFPLLERAAALPACRFPVDWEAGAAAVFPHFAKVRAASRMLAAKAIMDARHGDSSKALNDIALIFRISDGMSGEPSMISQLVRVACQAIGVNALGRVLEIAPPSAQEARQMFDALGRIDEMRPFTHALEGERCFGLWVFDAIRRDPAYAAEMFGDVADRRIAAGRGLRERVLARLLMLAWLPFLNQDEVLCIRRMNSAVGLSRLAFREAKQESEALERRAQGLPKYALLARILPQVFFRAVDARDRATARIGLAQCGMALRAYQEAMGRYPASLKELRGRISWPLPADPFIGKDFIYRKTGAGYLLYSIGPNMKDEGGKDRTSLTGPPGKQPPDDIAWRMSR